MFPGYFQHISSMLYDMCLLDMSIFQCNLIDISLKLPCVTFTEGVKPREYTVFFVSLLTLTDPKTKASFFINNHNCKY